jgi:tetratricopeptide (TPR) repeat protein
VVTDFGLARGSPTGDHFASLPGVGGLVGTPAYMAPEQFEGGEVTAATDIYALGIVIYEMLTGTQPLVGESPVSTGLKRLREAPASPRIHVPSLDPKWEAAILRCLERDPADRFASAADVVKAFSGEEVAAGKRALEQRKKRRRRLALAGIAGLLTAAFLVGHKIRVSQNLFQTVTPPGSPLPATAIKARRSVAVLGFKNLSGHPDAAWLSTALAEMLTTELGAGESLRMIPGENVARMKIELSLADADSLARDTLAKIRANLGAELVVLGSYTALGKESGGQLRLDLRLQDAAAGETIASVAATGTEAKLFDLVLQAGVSLRRKLGVGGVSGAEAGVVRASFPSNPRAARFYSEGLAKLRIFDALAARDLLEKAVAADPQRPLAHSALAQAWSALGYDAKAKDEAKRAFDLSADLSREERLSIEGRYREMMQDREKAVEIYDTLWGFFADNLEYGLRLANAQISAGKGKEALATIEGLRRLPAPAPDDARIDLAETSAAALLSDFKRQQAAAAKAAEKGTAQGARLLVARSRISEGSASLSLGEPAKAAAAWEDARRIYAAAGDRGGVAQALHSSAAVLYNQGDLSEAKKMFEQSLSIRRDIGAQSGVMSALNAIAAVHYAQGNLGEAKKMFSESLAIAREIGSTTSAAQALNNIGNVLYNQGELAGAKKMFEEALAVWREIGNKNNAAAALNNIGEVLYLLGDLAAAGKTYDDSLSIRREIGDKRGASRTLNNIGTVLKDQGDVAGAKKVYEEALEIRNALGEKGTAAETGLALAIVLLEEGRPTEAEKSARESAAEFQTEKALDSEASARDVLARCLLAQGRPAEAQKEIDRAAALSQKSGYRSVGLSVSITGARARAASGKPAEAAKSLAATVERATAAGFLGLQLEARLALGEIEMTSSNSASGRARLQALENEARAKGFGLIARKAASRRP